MREAKCGANDSGVGVGDGAIDGFVSRWQRSAAAERANYQAFLIELCDILGVPHPDPAGPDDTVNAYVFERMVTFHHGTTSVRCRSGHTEGISTLAVLPDGRRARDEEGSDGISLHRFILRIA